MKNRTTKGYPALLPYTGDTEGDKKVALRNQRAIRIALRILEDGGNLLAPQRHKLREALSLARAIRRGTVKYL